MIFATLCRSRFLAEPKRRHSWSSEADYYLPNEYSDREGDYDDDQFSENESSSDKDGTYIEFDLLASCNGLTLESVQSNSEQEQAEMGQGTSLQTSRPKLSLTWVLRGSSEPKHMVPAPEPPIRFQYSKTRRKGLVKKTEQEKKSDARKCDKCRDGSENGDKCSSKKCDKKCSRKSIRKSVENINKSNEIKCEENYQKRNLLSQFEVNSNNNKNMDSLKKLIYSNNDKCYQLKNTDLYDTQSDFYQKKVGNLKLISDVKSINRNSKSKDYFNRIIKPKLTPKHIENNKKVTKSFDNDVFAENYRNLKLSNTDEIKFQNSLNESYHTGNSCSNAEFSEKRTTSEPMLAPSNDRTSREKVRQKRRPRSRVDRNRISRFGYDIEDVDAFLTKASLEKPANIPVVLSFPSVLYQTHISGPQDEVPLPLGMVVNAIFKQETWLYVQTPHGEEGYVSYTACLPLGIIPQSEEAETTAPCWESSTDVFPHPCGNMTDSEKLTRSECGGTKCRSRRMRRTALSTCGERSVDRLYLRAAANSKISRAGGIGKRQTLLVVNSDYTGRRKNTISVAAGDVVALISAHIKDWFWVRARDGSEGFIPASIAGNGYL